LIGAMYNDTAFNSVSEMSLGATWYWESVTSGTSFVKTGCVVEMHVEGLNHLMSCANSLSLSEVKIWEYSSVAYIKHETVSISNDYIVAKWWFQQV
jgi:hypothetical protein